MKKLVLDGSIQYFMGMERPTNVTFEGTAYQSGRTYPVTCRHLEEIVEERIISKYDGSGSLPQNVKITIEWD